jgi:hypothetical protein
MFYFFIQNSYHNIDEISLQNCQAFNEISSTIFGGHLIAKNISGPLCHWPKYDHSKDFNKYNFSKNLFKALKNTSNVKGDDMKRQMGWLMGDSLCIFPCDVKRQIKKINMMKNH